jgi:hypothetical protein
MKTNALTAQNCSLFEIDAELEAAFDQMQEEREITGNISDEAREHCMQLFWSARRSQRRDAPVLPVY